MKTDPDELERVFSAALELRDPARRSAFLKAACGEDNQLRTEIEQLLRHDQEAGRLLDRPAVAPLTDSEAPRPRAEALGTQIGPYKLLQEIGEGGFGVVYMAEQIKPVRRKVALKIIKPGMDTRQVVARFEAERQALALMDHPNIARVLDGGATDSGRPYFVMELVKGLPLTEFCDNNQISTRHRLQLFVTVCRAIQHAHQKSVIHRDIKPSNVMVTLHDGQPVPKVIDFGVSKAINQQLTERTMFTAYGQMIGTPQYMSPEQAEMSGLDVDTRSDIYSLGVLLYELLTGSTPLTEERLRGQSYSEIQRLIRDEEPPRPSSRLSTLGEASASVAAQRGIEPSRLRTLLRDEIDWIVMKALEKDRSRRYETANGLAADVQRYLDDEPVVARPLSAGYRLRKIARRYKALFATTAVVAGTLILGTAVSVWQAVRARHEAVRAIQAEKTARQESDKAQQREYNANSLLMQMMWEQNNILGFNNLLERQKPGPDQNDRRGFEWHYWWNTSGRGHDSLEGHSAPVASVAFSPDGRLLASGAGKPSGVGEIVLWDLTTREVVRRFDCRHRVHEVAFSPDGKRLASAIGEVGAVEGSVKLWDLDTGQELFNEPFSNLVDSVAFSPDGTHLVAGGNVVSAKGGAWKVWDLATGQEVFAQGYEGKGVRGVTFSADGQQIAVGSRQEDVHGIRSSQVELWDLATGKVRVLPAEEEYVFGVAYGPSGQRLAAAVGAWREPGVVKLWNVTTRQELPFPLKGHSGRVRSVCFNRDGSQIATASDDNTLKVWDAETGKEIHTLRGHTKGVSSVAFSPDASHLASGSADKSVRLWDANRGQEARILRGHTFWVDSVAFSSDGQRIASGALDGTVKVWDTKTSTEILSLAGHTGQVRDVTFSPDGSHLATASGSVDGSGDVKVWHLAKQVMVHHFAGHTKPVTSVAFSPDGKRLASSSGESSGEWESPGDVKVWELKSGREVVPPPREQSRVVSNVTFSPDGKYLAYGNLEAIKVTGTVPGQTKAIGSRPARGIVKLWNVDEGHEVFALEGHNRAVISVAFSSDGSRLACGSVDFSIKVWDLETGEAIHTLRGHEARVSSLAFSPDVRRLVSCGLGDSVKLWDLGTGQEVFTIKQFVTTVAFSPDGQFIATGSHDGTIMVWDGTLSQ